MSTTRSPGWSVNDVILMGARTGLRSVAATGGPVTEVSRLEPEHFAHKWPVFLPDGRHFLYGGHRREWTSAPLDLFLGSLDGIPPQRLGESWSGPIYAEPGFVLSVGFPARTLVAQRLDIAARRFVGPRVPLTSDLVLISQRWTTPVSASSVGGLVYMTGYDAPLRRPTWTDRAGLKLDAGDSARFGELALSPDGRRAVATIGDDDRATYDLWEIDVAHRRPATRLTDTPDDEQVPIWTSGVNEQEIFYAARRRGSVVDIYRRRAEAGSRERLVRALEGEGRPCDVSRDGKWLLFAEHPAGEPPSGVSPVS